MSRALLICARGGEVHAAEALLAAIDTRLTPDGLAPAAPDYACAGGVLAAVLRPGAASARNGLGLRLGAVDRSARDGWTPGAPVPDGCFALLRVNAEAIEVVADSTASRTIWYALTDEWFVASSSQRAIVMCLASFEPNPVATAWMISSSALGPGEAWDRRVAAVPPGGRVTLDRRNWRLQVAAEPIRFEPAHRPVRQHRERLEQAVLESVRELDHDPSRWLMPLSGGIDSRGLLLAYLRAGIDPARIRCITWGQPAALDQPESDAVIARRLAGHFGLEHRYFETPLHSAENHDTIIRRFLIAGEGRVAHITGYLDGFALWRRLHDERCAGVLRGDEGFGAYPVRHEVHARASIGLTTLTDYFDAETVRAFELAEQRLPEDLQRSSRESLTQWRDRARHRFRLPVVLAALTDLKTAYVEVLNPLLCRRVIECIRQLPDDLRTDKRIWKGLVDEWSPSIAYAREAATVPMRAYLTDPALLALMHDELSGSQADSALGPACRRLLRGHVESAIAARPARPAASGRIGRLRRKVRSRVLKLRGVLPPPDPLMLAFHGVMVSRMHALLAEDAIALERMRDADVAGPAPTLARSNA